MCGLGDTGSWDEGTSTSQQQNKGRDYQSRDFEVVLMFVTTEDDGKKPPASQPAGGQV